MTAPIIEVSRLGKRYRLGMIGATRLADDVEYLWHRLTGKAESREAKDFWALQDIGFAVQPGEVVGLIGHNGAGKSTLLKVLSRITQPTTGEIVLRGRVASLLEVGTGFVGDLSGRDNIFLNGALLGMRRSEIRSKFDEIVAFAEVEQFIDTPVKRYSSGMYVRLAFAVAAHLEPEILIVDEVLAVGDVQFQKKCLGKMGEVSRNGRTILFVSHNMIAVQSLCTRAVMLKSGRLVADDSVDRVVSRYLEEVHRTSTEQVWDEATAAPGNELVRIRSVRVRSAHASEGRMLTMQHAIHVDTEYWVMPRRSVHHLVYHLTNDQGVVVLTTSGAIANMWEPGLYQASFTIPANLLNSGTYFLKLIVVENGNHPTYMHDGLVSFVVVDAAARKHGNHGREPGVIQVHLPWEVARIAS